MALSHQMIYEWCSLLAKVDYQCQLLLPISKFNENQNNMANSVKGKEGIKCHWWWMWVKNWSKCALNSDLMKVKSYCAGEMCGQNVDWGGPKLRMAQSQLIIGNFVGHRMVIGWTVPLPFPHCEEMGIGISAKLNQMEPMGTAFSLIIIWNFSNLHQKFRIFIL